MLVGIVKNSDHHVRDARHGGVNMWLSTVCRMWSLSSNVMDAETECFTNKKMARKEQNQVD